jgi:hypothetical protein
MIQAAKIIGTGLATTGLIGAGVGIGVVLGALIIGVSYLGLVYLLLSMVICVTSIVLIYANLNKYSNKLDIFLTSLILVMMLFFSSTRLIIYCMY